MQIFEFNFYVMVKDTNSLTVYAKSNGKTAAVTETGQSEEQELRKSTLFINSHTRQIYQFLKSISCHLYVSIHLRNIGNQRFSRGIR